MIFITETFPNEFFYFHFEYVEIKTTLVVTNWDFSGEHMIDFEYFF